MLVMYIEGFTRNIFLFIIPHEIFNIIILQDWYTYYTYTKVYNKKLLVGEKRLYNLVEFI